MRIWMGEAFSFGRFATSALICALGLGAFTHALATPPQILPGSLQAPNPGPNSPFRVNLLEQGLISGTAPVSVVAAQVLRGGEPVSGYEISTSGVCVQVERGTVPVPGATYSLRVTLANSESRAVVGIFPLTNSPAPLIRDSSCSYPNTPPAAAIAYNIVSYDTQSRTARVEFVGSGTDAQQDQLSYDWQIMEGRFEGAQIEADLPEGQTLVVLRVSDQGDGTTEARATVNVTIPVEPSLELGDPITVTDIGAPGELVEIVPAITGTPLRYEWTFDDSTSSAAIFRETLEVGRHLVSLRVEFEGERVFDDEVEVNVVAPPNQPPTADASLTETTHRDDDTPGVAVTLNGRASTDPDGQVASYTWIVNSNASEPVQTPEHGITLLPGTHNITLTVTDDDGATSAPDAIVIRVEAANAAPTAIATGPTQPVPDNDGNEGETGVPLNGSSSFDPENGPLTYSWRNEQGVEIGTGPTPNVTLTRDGANVVTLVVTDNEGLASQPATVTINVAAPQELISNAGPDQTTADEDGLEGDLVTLNGSGSTGPGIAYRWMLGEMDIGEPAVETTVRLPDGVNNVRLMVTDRFNRSAFDTVQITVRARPTANAGANRTANDEDGEPGEVVPLSGAASRDRDPDGEIVSYQWYDQPVEAPEQLLGSGAQISPRLTDGVHTIRLVVTDNSGLEDEATIQVTVTEPDEPEPQPPTVSAGEPQSVPDTDGAAGEEVDLTGTASDPEQGPLTYRWVLQDGSEGGRVLGSTLSLTNVDLPDGVNNVTFEATDNQQLTARAEVTITVGAPQTPTVDAGANQSVPDSDQADGEDVVLTGTATDGDGPIASYTWFLGERELGTGASLSTRMPDGEHSVTLRVRDTQRLEATDTVQITVGAPARAPTANAGADQNVADGDGVPGELVTLTGTGTDPDGTIATYQWMLGTTVLGNGATLQARIPDGVSAVTLTVTDNSGLTATDTAQITVVAPVLPIVTVGIARTIEDTDLQMGEDVELSGSATGTITQYQWLLGNNVLGNGATITARLPDGVNLVTLRATNSANLVGTASVQITVTAGVRTVLANIPGLSPNERRLAQKLDEACNNVLGPTTAVAPIDEGTGSRDGAPIATKGARPPTEAEVSDFTQKCRGLLRSRDNAALADAMGAILGDDFAVARTQTLLFANTQYASVMDRLIALRGGAKGLSLAGLNIMVDGEMIPLAELQGLAKQFLGGGASSDADLWGDKWGLWARGNYSFGSKKDDRLSPSFDADQYALLAGLDYRLSQSAVIGGALAYGNSNVEFNPTNEGSLDTESWAVSLYGSLYAKKNFYFDAIVNVADSSYQAERNITYVDGFGLINTDASGDTGGLTMSGGASIGYDFLIGGLTISPTLGVFYIDAQIDEFTEAGAGGLNLIYDEQQFKSLTGNLGVRMTFAWNLPFGVLLPHLRADFVREFEDDVDVFGIRFAADPNAASTPPILVETENPDSSYWRLAAGFSAQFKHGISGYVEYQRLESFEFISFQDISVGLRFQAAF
jgi:outer membrane autotransporter protein